MSDESAENLLNQSTTSEPGIDLDSLRPMPVPVEPKKKEFSSEVEGIEAAAREVAKSREEREAATLRLQTDDDGVIERLYYRNDTGERIPSSEYISIEKAAQDLSDVRQRDLASISPTVGEVQAGIDAARQQYAEAVQPQPTQPQQQPQAQTVEAQPQDPNAEIRQVLEQYPAVRQALEAEVQQVEQARAAYAQQARQAAQMAGASLLATFPELANVPTDQLGTAISSIAQVNPQRAQAINAHLERTSALLNMAGKAQEAQAQLQAQQTAAWTKAQDDAYDAMTKDDTPEMRNKIGTEAIAMLREYGASDADIKAAWESPGAFRSAIGQRILRDAAAYRIAQREVVNKVDRSVPPVQRPGTGQPTNRDSGVEDAIAKFRANPTPLTGAAVLAARRAARK